MFTQINKHSMNKTLLLTILLFSSMGVTAQRSSSMEYDIFGNIVATSPNGVKSSLEVNIFDDIVFSDSNRNKITYKSKFLQKVAQKSAKDKAFQKDLFSTLSFFLRDKKNYIETYDVNIFDQVIISNNIGDNIKMDLSLVDDKDRFFWMNRYKIENEKVLQPNRRHIIRDAFDNLSYRKGQKWARLIITRYGEAEYEDSYDNRVKFNKSSLDSSLDFYRGDDNFFEYLLDIYLRE